MFCSTQSSIVSSILSNAAGGAVPRNQMKNKMPIWKACPNRTGRAGRMSEFFSHLSLCRLVMYSSLSFTSPPTQSEWSQVMHLRPVIYLPMSLLLVYGQRGYGRASVEHLMPHEEDNHKGLCFLPSLSFFIESSLIDTGPLACL